MSRTRFATLVALALATACAPKPVEMDKDPVAASLDSIPKVPRVMGFEAGKASDAMGMIFGGTTTTFYPSDTIHVSVMTQHVGVGSKILVSLHDGETLLAEQTIDAPVADTAGKAMVAIKLGAPGAAWKTGKYQLRVELDKTPQMSKEIDVIKP